MNKKFYQGEPGGAVMVTLPSGKSRPLRQVVLHSPIGFGWGYSGGFEVESETIAGWLRKRGVEV